MKISVNMNGTGNTKKPYYRVSDMYTVHVFIKYRKDPDPGFKKVSDTNSEA